MEKDEAFHREPEILSGAPVFVGTRVPVSALRDYVQAKLGERWSPEQVCHALVVDHPDDPTRLVPNPAKTRALNAVSTARADVAAAPAQQHEERPAKQQHDRGEEQSGEQADHDRQPRVANRHAGGAEHDRNVDDLWTYQPDYSVTGYFFLHKRYPGHPNAPTEPGQWPTNIPRTMQGAQFLDKVTMPTRPACPSSWTQC